MRIKVLNGMKDGFQQGYQPVEAEYRAREVVLQDILDCSDWI